MSIFLSVFLTGSLLLAGSQTTLSPNSDYGFDPLQFSTNTTVCYSQYVAEAISHNMNTRYANITILTPGMGGSYFDWVKRVSDQSLSFFMDEDTLPYQLCCNPYRLDNNGQYLPNQDPQVYILSDKNNSRYVYSLSYDSDNNTFLKNNNLSNFSNIDLNKQIVFLYDGYTGSGEHNSSNTYYQSEDAFIFSLFDDCVNRVVSGIANLQNGYLPRINLIGHSRGGLINLLYAHEHPKIVKNLISLGTPYVGSDWASAYVDANKIINTSFNAYDDMLDTSHPQLYSSYLYSVSDYLNSFAIGFNQTFSYFSNSLTDYITEHGIGALASELYLLSGNLVDLNFWQQIAQPLVSVLLNYASNPISLETLSFASTLLNNLNIQLSDPVLSNLISFLTNLTTILSTDVDNQNFILNSDVCVNLDSQLGYFRGTTSERYYFTDRLTITLGDSNNNNYFNYAHCAWPNAAWIAHNFETKNPTAISAILSFLNNHGGFHVHSFSLVPTNNQCHHEECTCNIKKMDINHTLTHHKHDDNFHIRFCSVCGHTFYELHNFSYVNHHLSHTHTKTCSICNYTSTQSHVYNIYQSYSVTKHRVVCECGDIGYLEDHDFDLITSRCIYCNRLAHTMI